MDALTQTAPERIWLDFGDIDYVRTDHTFEAQRAVGDVGWCESDALQRATVPYIRADLAGQWKPISDMPEELKDGRTWSLGYDPNMEQPLAVRWIDRYQHWCDIHSNGHVITHWMPLPTAPQSEAEEGEWHG